MPYPLHDAIVLVGGQGQRLGGLDKAAVELAGRSLVSSSLRAAAHAATLVVVGQTSAPLPEHAVLTQEDPPGTGPAAGFAAGLAAVQISAEWTLLLGCDIPGADLATQHLLMAASESSPHDDGFVLTDPAGRMQWVLGLYRSRAVRERAVEGGPSTHRSLRALVDGLALTPVPAVGQEWHDVDTWDDHDQWRARLRDA